eukprot:1897964-Alexandrium_andersonii.AAC.1
MHRFRAWLAASARRAARARYLECHSQVRDRRQLRSTTHAAVSILNRAGRGDSTSTVGARMGCG